MIVGTGIDITEVGRIRNSLDRFGERFLRHIYTAGEIAYCQARKVRAAESYAARFAAKEAAAKALGTGIGKGIMWKEIEVQRRQGHAPTIQLSGRAAEWATHLGVRNISLSLTHTAQMAMAMVTMEDGK
jgi:holo-[acyl-carrier protein] synthase